MPRKPPNRGLRPGESGHGAPIPGEDGNCPAGPVAAGRRSGVHSHSTGIGILQPDPIPSLISKSVNTPESSGPAAGRPDGIPDLKEAASQSYFLVGARRTLPFKGYRLGPVDEPAWFASGVPVVLAPSIDIGGTAGAGHQP